ncbi:MAG: hypothetical protein LRY55_04510, partial [Leadbetterella sp.]|nr:hypothetical protein [Leadbetterella sp.]
GLCHQFRGTKTLKSSLRLLALLRNKEVGAEIYPDTAKIKKQFEYADRKGIPFVLIAGPEEIVQQAYLLKNMITGEQIQLSEDELNSKDDLLKIPGKTITEDTFNFNCQ